jgi:hypothetical protein
MIKNKKAGALGCAAGANGDQNSDQDQKNYPTLAKEARVGHPEVFGGRFLSRCLGVN